MLYVSYYDRLSAMAQRALILESEELTYSKFFHPLIMWQRSLHFSLMFLDYLQVETEKYTGKQIKMKYIWENILQYTAEQRYPGKHFF